MAADAHCIRLSHGIGLQRGAGGREARWVTPGAFVHVLNDVFALTAAP